MDEEWHCLPSPLPLPSPPPPWTPALQRRPNQCFGARVASTVDSALRTRVLQFSASLEVGTSIIPFYWSRKLRLRAVRGLPKVMVRPELCLAPLASCCLKVLAHGCRAKGWVSDLGVSLWSGYHPPSSLLPPNGDPPPAPSPDALSRKKDFDAPGQYFTFRAPRTAGSQTSKGQAGAWGCSDSWAVDAEMVA